MYIIYLTNIFIFIFFKFLIYEKRVFSNFLLIKFIIFLAFKMVKTINEIWGTVHTLLKQGNSQSWTAYRLNVKRHIMNY